MITALFVFTLAAPPVEVAPPPRPAEVQRVGRLVLDGNHRTPDNVILKHIPLRPGQPLPPTSELAKIERKLLVRFAARFDLDAGRWPTVRTLPQDNDSAFVDVVVSFPEREAERPPLARPNAGSFGTPPALHPPGSHDG